MKTAMKTTILAVAVLATAGGAFADGWQVETVDDYGQVGWHTSIAIDSNNNPHISYFDLSNGDLKYAYWTGYAWSITSLDTTGTVGPWTSIALDSTDNPHISYYDDSNSDLKYTYRAGSTWLYSSVDVAGYLGLFTSIALDSNDNPHISYKDYSINALKYAYWTGSAWSITSVDTSGDVGLYTSIALDSNDNPHISYFYHSGYDLKYAYRTGSAWSITSVDTGGDVGWHTSIAVDSNDNPHISYYDNSNFDLKYAYWIGSTWAIASVDIIGNVGGYTSIALDSNDDPHISYYDESNGDLKYTHRPGGPGWKFTSVDTAGDVGKDTSIALDSSDNPHISYCDKNNMGLKYAFYNQAPHEFALLSPPHYSYFYILGTLDWEDSDDGGQNEMRYDLWFSTEPDFDPRQERIGLIESEYTFRAGQLVDGETYHWKVAADDGYDQTWCTAPGGGGEDEYWTYHATSSGIDDEDGNIPTSFALHPAVPNPSNGSASIGFALPRACEVELTLYDVKGRKVTTLTEGMHQPGEYSATASGLSSGVYIYELKADEFGDTKKMVVK